MAESTALEALTAELLGDVGKLHDEIKALPGLLTATSAELERQTGVLIQAKKLLIADINKYINEQAKAAAANCTTDVERQIRGLVNSAVQESLGAPLEQTISNIKSVTNEAQKSIKATENHIEKVAEKTWIKTAWWALLAGVFGGLATAITLQIFVK